MRSTGPTRCRLWVQILTIRSSATLYMDSLSCSFISMEYMYAL
jgi:hypothetical protein